MGVRDDNPFDLEIVFLDERKNVAYIIAWVNDHRFMRSLVTDDGTVALKRPDRQDFVDHKRLAPDYFCGCAGFAGVFVGDEL